MYCIKAEFDELLFFIKSFYCLQVLRFTRAFIFVVDRLHLWEYVFKCKLEFVEKTKLLKMDSQLIFTLLGAANDF